MCALIRHLPPSLPFPPMRTLQRWLFYTAVGAKAKQLGLSAQSAVETATSAEQIALGLDSHCIKLAAVSSSETTGNTGRDSTDDADPMSLNQLRFAADALSVFQSLQAREVPTADAVHAIDAITGRESQRITRFITRASLSLAPRPERLSTRALRSIAYDFGKAFHPSHVSENAKLLTLSRCPVVELFNRCNTDESTALPVRELAHSVCCDSVVSCLPPELAITVSSTIASGCERCSIIKSAR